MLIRVLLCRRPIVISLSVRHSVRLKHVSSLPLAQSKSKVKVITELYIKSLSGAYFLSLWSSLAHTSLIECLWSKGVQ